MSLAILSWALVETYYVQANEIVIRRKSDMVQLVLAMQHKIEKEIPDLTNNEKSRGALDYSRSSSQRASQRIEVFETQKQFSACKIEFHHKHKETHCVDNWNYKSLGGIIIMDVRKKISKS